MRAATLLNHRITVSDLPTPTPGPHQVLVKTLLCAICASDAHFLTSAEAQIENAKKYGGAYASIDLTREIAMGHEFVAEIVEYGHTSRSRPPGSEGVCPFFGPHRWGGGKPVTSGGDPSTTPHRYRSPVRGC